MNKATEIKEEKKKPPFKKGIEWLSETIEIGTMFRILGKQGIFIPVTKTNKSGMVRMGRFMLDEAYTVKESQLQGLKNFIIYNDRGHITLLKAFDNLQKEFDNKPTNDFNLDFISNIMGAICPNHDYRFKDYHAIKIVKWYNEIITAINKATK